MEIEQLAEHLGARVHGLTLDDSLTDSQFADLHRAFLDHLVLVVPEQHLRPHQQLKLARQFGEPEPPHPLFPAHPDEPQVTVIENDADSPPENDTWHSDVTWRRTPPLGSILQAQVMPATGGNTRWSSMYAIYDALTDEDKTRFESMRGVHSIETFAGSLNDSEDGGRVREALSKHPPVEHPMIRTHPETGRRGLFVNEGFTTHIADIDTGESERILSRLWKMVDDRQFRVEVEWSPGTVVIWDNRCTQHFAAADYYPEHRRMHRVTIIGDEPRMVAH